MATNTPTLHSGLIARARRVPDPDPIVVPIIKTPDYETDLDRLFTMRRAKVLPVATPVYSAVDRKQLTVRVEPGLRARLDAFRGERSLQSVLHEALIGHLSRGH